MRNWFDLVDEICLYFQANKPYYLIYCVFGLLQLPINGFKTRQPVFCPKQDVYFRIFCPEQGQGYKPSAAHLFPNVGGVPPAPAQGKLFPFYLC